MKDYTLMFVLIDDLIDEVEKIEETLIINHTLKVGDLFGKYKRNLWYCALYNNDRNNFKHNW